MAEKPKPDKTDAPEPPDPASLLPEGLTDNLDQKSDHPIFTIIPADPLQEAARWAAAHPWIIPILLVIILVVIKYGWKTLVEKSQQRFISLTPSFRVLFRRVKKIAFKLDVEPRFQRPQKFAEKMLWYKWKHYNYTIIVITILWFIIPPTNFIPLEQQQMNMFWLYGLGVILVLWFFTYLRLRRINGQQHRTLMQMFEVASAEMKYPGGSELNPWGWVIIHDWQDLWTPDVTEVRFPPKYRSEEENIREAFQRNFNGTVSDEHSWIYKWESSNNRVIASPVPFITTKALYPFPDTHPWNEFPVGIKAGGEEAVVKVSEFPHTLIAGTTGSGKLVRLSDTLPVPISDHFPTGWAQVGKIKPGDQLFDEKGNVSTVTGLSEIVEKPELYNIEFSDGTIFCASGDHLWYTETRKVRESRSNAKRKKVERRALIKTENQKKLLEWVANTPSNTEATMAEIAKTAGVAPESIWLREIAQELGHVGEIQILVDFEYKEQIVTQKQNVITYPARSTWLKLAEKPYKAPSWFDRRNDFLELSKKTCEKEQATISELASQVDIENSIMADIVRKNAADLQTKEKARINKYHAKKLWERLSQATNKDEQKWLEYRSECLRLANRTTDNEYITGKEVAAVIGVKTIPNANRFLKNRGIVGEKKQIEVKLKIPGKTFQREFNTAKTYLLHEFVKRLLVRVETPAHDQRHKNAVGGVRTTREIMETLRTESGHANHAIPVAKPLKLPEVDLPIEPYLLGVFLGDGSSLNATIVGIDHEIVDHISGKGFTFTSIKPPVHQNRHPDYRTWQIHGLRQLLRTNGLLRTSTKEHKHSRKHIPPAYLRASIQQRRELLAGLLDTDGTVAPQGAVQFTNTNRKLAYGVHELALSLGYRATITEGRAKIKGVDKGPKWTVSWTCEESPFRLSRKTRTHQERNKNYSVERNSVRYITNITPAESEPARCIMVDSPSRLFLAGESFIPTHNSVTQRTILLHALQSPSWRVALVDPKRVELSQYSTARNVLAIATELEEATELIEQIEQEMQARFLKMRDESVNHFTNMENPPPAVLLMVDEVFALLSMENMKSDEGKLRDEMHERCTTLIAAIARLGRAAGVHLVLATQRPDAKVLPGEVRALDVDTVLPTPDGWTTIRKVKEGDYLLDDQGRKTRVVGVTEEMLDHDCYEIKFSDGEKIVADAGHLWESHDILYRMSQQRLSRITKRVKRQYPTREPSIVTTEQIYNTLKYNGKSNHAIPVADALELPEVDLPISPYLLGVWLGDGNRCATTFTSVDEEIVEMVRKEGFEVYRIASDKRQITWQFMERGQRPNRWNPGIKGKLRSLNLLKNKHIPEAYLRASRKQRMELLAGLLDTDGHNNQRIGKSRKKRSTSQVCFTTVSYSLASQVVELVRTLGYRPTLSNRPSRKFGGGDFTGQTAWRVIWTPHDTVFRLSRKVKGQNLLPEHSDKRTRYRYIVDVCPVASRPVKCVSVDSPSHLFLAGEGFIPTHNSNLDVRIAQGRMDTTPSLMVLDSDHATHIPKVKGRAVLRQGDYTEFQAYFLPDEDLPQVLEMSNAIAEGIITPQDLLPSDTVEEKSGGRLSQLFAKVPRPNIPLPKGLKGRVEEWVRKRQSVVDENETRAGRRERQKDVSPVDEGEVVWEGEEETTSFSPRGQRDLSPAEIAAAAETLGQGKPSRESVLDRTPVPSIEEIEDRLGFLVGDVLRRAEESGVPISSSELIAALQGELAQLEQDLAVEESRGGKRGRGHREAAVEDEGVDVSVSSSVGVGEETEDSILDDILFGDEEEEEETSGEGLDDEEFLRRKAEYLGVGKEETGSKLGPPWDVEKEEKKEREEDEWGGKGEPYFPEDDEEEEETAGQSVTPPNNSVYKPGPPLPVSPPAVSPGVSQGVPARPTRPQRPSRPQRPGAPKNGGGQEVPPVVDDGLQEMP